MLITASSNKHIYSVDGAGQTSLLDEDEVDVVGFLQNPDDVYVYDSGMFDEEDDTTLPNAAGPIASLDENTDSYKTTADDDDDGYGIKQRPNLLKMLKTVLMSMVIVNFGRDSRRLQILYQQ